MSIKNVTKLSVLLGITIFLPGIVSASPMDNFARELYAQKIQPILSESVVNQSITRQNQQHQALTQAEIDQLDANWRDGVASGGQNIIHNVLSNALSEYLVGVVDAEGGLFSEVFVMDNKGLNVGQSGITSDYWQGDEAKWQQTYLQGSGSIHVSDVEFDESSQTYQVQISVAITDSDSGQVIGAATFGVNAETLESL